MNTRYEYTTYIPSSTLNQHIAWLECRSDDKSLLENMVAQHVYPDRKIVRAVVDERDNARCVDVLLYDEDENKILSGVYGLDTMNIDIELVFDDVVYGFQICERCERCE